MNRPGQEDVITKRRASTGKEVHYFIGPIRETSAGAEEDRLRWAEAERLRAEVAEVRAAEARAWACHGAAETQRDALADTLQQLRSFCGTVFVHPHIEPDRWFIAADVLPGTKFPRLTEIYADVEAALKLAGRL